MIPGTEGYADAAPTLLRTRLDFAEVHAPFLHLIPSAPSRVLDIGAGPGHDAAHLAAMGHEVVAAEPTPALLSGARALYGETGVRWIADALPGLASVTELGERFDFILISGVWAHLDEPERRAAMPKAAMLLEPGGALALSLRHGPAPAGRRLFEVSARETVALAARCGLETVVNLSRGSIQQANRAAGVTWTLLAFRRTAAPDA